ncbi:DedA family protein [Azospirillum sp. TSO22-1]|uniref:DedA family protein n=1 Tax=Azospirillum sp. TSO22-1 TaxID=716789 RepID=UPI000D60B6DC|nr:DedA family protein [Azospirillum sp. TSO22-1]PWC54717.1 alkaline phosphatase [Azospirillum sp. TSO22-1]
MTEWVTGIVAELGYGGIFLLLVLARVVPPVPAETVIPLAGMGAATGSFSLAGVILAGGLGSAVGELFWYLPSRLLGRERFVAFLHRHGRWITVKPEQVERATDWFARRGGIAVLLCQPLPGLRTLISIPAGACGLPPAPFFLYAVAGSCVQVSALAVTGYLVRSGFPQLADCVVPAALAMVAAVLVGYVVRVVRHRGSA